jgi:hypothetical protein
MWSFRCHPAATRTHSSCRWAPMRAWARARLPRHSRRAALPGCPGAQPAAGGGARRARQEAAGYIAAHLQQDPIRTYPPRTLDNGTTASASQAAEGCSLTVAVLARHWRVGVSNSRPLGVTVPAVAAGQLKPRHRFGRQAEPLVAARPDECWAHFRPKCAAKLSKGAGLIALRRGPAEA